MNKICTSQEQSLKLIELGIDVNTADMYYQNRVGSINYPLPIEYKRGLPLLSQEIAAWSLTALLEIMPKSIISTPNPFGTNYCCRNIEFDMEFYADNPLDTAFEMVCWLKENKKL